MILRLYGSIISMVLSWIMSEYGSNSLFLNIDFFFLFNFYKKKNYKNRDEGKVLDLFNKFLLFSINMSAPPHTLTHTYSHPYTYINWSTLLFVVTRDLKRNRCDVETGFPCVYCYVNWNSYKAKLTIYLYTNKSF